MQRSTHRTLQPPSVNHVRSRNITIGLWVMASLSALGWLALAAIAWGR